MVAQKRPVTSRDLWSLRFVGEPVLSPCGNTLAWSESWTNAKKNHYESAIYASHRKEDGIFGDPIRLTYGKRPDGDGSMDRIPAFSPDGKQLAFMSNRSGKNHIWLLDIGNGGEARQLTAGDDSPSQMSWSPCGKRIAFVAKEPKPKESEGPCSGGPASGGTQSGEPNPAEGPNLEQIRTGKDVVLIKNLRYKANGVPGVLDQRPSHIYIIEVESGEISQVTSGDFNDSAPSFSPDGKYVAFSSCREPGREIKMIHNDIWVAPVEGGSPVKLTKGQGPAQNPIYSPDGKWIAFLGHLNGLSSTSNTEVLIVPAAGGEVKSLWNGFDRSYGPGAGSDSRMDAGGAGPFWSPDGNSLYFILSDKGYSGIYKVSLDGKGPEFVGGGVPGNIDACPNYPPVVNSLTAAFPKDGSVALAFNGCSTLSPNDIFAVKIPVEGCEGPGDAASADSASLTEPASPADLAGAANPASAAGAKESARSRFGICPLQQVTKVNEEFLSTLELSKPEPFTFKSSDGLVLDGWVMKPIGFKADKKYPAVIQVHGGPHSAYGEAFFHEMQLLTSNGFGVFYCNPRGSSCYGKEFADGVIGDWGGMDYQDVMALRQVVAGTPWVDDAKVGVTGGSYGGYMTNWVVTQTDRFAAAVSCRSISNMYTKYGISDIGWYGNKAGFAGRDLWDSEDFIMERSPMRHAPKVVTPLLLVHSEQDYRCPLEQAEQFFVALKRLGKTVEFLKIAGENHELSRSGKPWNRVERVDHILGWFVRFLR